MRVARVISAVAVLGLFVIGVARAQEAPPAPTDLLVDDTDHRSFDSLFLTWHDNAGNEVSYRVERSSAGESGPWEVINQVPPPTCADVIDPTRCVYVDRGLVDDTTYWYRVAAVNEAGISLYSNVASGTTLSRFTIANQIAGLVFHDKNGNGRRDPDEEGLGRRGITIKQGDNIVEEMTTEFSGNYGSAILPLGDYTVEAKLDDHWDFFMQRIPFLFQSSVARHVRRHHLALECRVVELGSCVIGRPWCHC